MKDLATSLVARMLTDTSLLIVMDNQDNKLVFFFLGADVVVLF